MSSRQRWFRNLALCGGLATLTHAAEAQPLGTFRWQLQPYCNVLTVNVVQAGGVYQVDGTDDQCGAPQKAGVAGLAYPNPSGSIGFGLTTVTPAGGIAVHVTAAISATTLGGTWRDSAGNSGPFVFTPGAGQPGSPRPVPASAIAPGSITSVQIAAGAVGAAQLSPNAVAGQQILDGSVTTADLQAAPRVSAISGEQRIVLSQLQVSGGPPDRAVIRSVTIAAATAGTVVVQASGYIEFQSAGTYPDRVNCSLTTESALEPGHQLVAAEQSGAVNIFAMPFASVRVFTVAAGSFTANFYCQAIGTYSTVVVGDTSLSAMFVGQ